MSLTLASTDLEPECAKSSATTYYWYRKTLDISDSISEGGGVNWKMTVSLLAGWILVCLAMIKGIKSSGKVASASAAFAHLLNTLISGNGHLYGANLDQTELFRGDVAKEKATGNGEKTEASDLRFSPRMEWPQVM